jgi:hypothetical protein
MTDLHTIMHHKADMAALRRRTRIALVCIAAVFASLLAGVWIGQGITQFNHDRMEAAQ